jgi:hypothetical protein
MKIRGKNNKWSGSLMNLDQHGISEIIVGYDDEPDGTPNGMDNEFISDCEVQLPDGSWKDLSQAFKDRDLLTDEYNIQVFFNDHKCHSCKEEITGEAITSIIHDFCSTSCRDKWLSTIKI